jgi:hypothetical protein
MSVLTNSRHWMRLVYVHALACGSCEAGRRPKSTSVQYHVDVVVRAKRASRRRQCGFSKPSANLLPAQARDSGLLGRECLELDIVMVAKICG